MIPLRAILLRLAHARHGAALVEFAIVLPVLLMLFLAGVQLSDVIACNRKVTITTRAVTDLLSQNSTVTPAKIDSMLGAATAVMTPYATTGAMVRVSEIVTTDYVGGYKVVWSRSNNNNSQPRPVNQTGALPAVAGAIWEPNISMILGEVTYPYSPIANFNYVRPMTLTQTLYMMPRKSDSVPCTGC